MGLQLPQLLSVNWTRLCVEEQNVKKSEVKERLFYNVLKRTTMGRFAVKIEE